MLHHFHRGQHARPSAFDAERARETDRVLADVALLVGVGRDVEGGVGDDDAARISRNRHHGAVAQQASGAQVCFFLHDRVQQHVGVQAALHQRRDFAGTGGHRGFQRRVLGTSVATMRYPEMSSFAASAILRVLRLRPEQYRHDQPGFGRLHRTGERLGAARVHHAGKHRLEPAAALQQALPADAPALRAVAASWAPRPPSWRWPPACPVGPVHCPSSITIPPSARFSRTTTCAVSTASIGRRAYLHRGRADGRSGPGRAEPTSAVRMRRDDPGRALCVGSLGEHARIAKGGGPGAYIARLQGALHRRGIAGLDLVECLVQDGRAW